MPTGSANGWSRSSVIRGRRTTESSRTLLPAWRGRDPGTEKDPPGPTYRPAIHTTGPTRQHLLEVGPREGRMRGPQGRRRDGDRPPAGSDDPAPRHARLIGVRPCRRDPAGSGRLVRRLRHGPEALDEDDVP